MAWLWSSYDQYKEAIDPYFIDHCGPFQFAIGASLFSQGQAIAEHVSTIRASHEELCKLGFDDYRSSNGSINDHVERLISQSVRAVEDLLIYDMRLHSLPSFYNLMHAKTLSREWARFDRRRLRIEICDFVGAVDEALRGYDQVVNEDDSFLVRIVESLSNDLKAHFVDARDLFSVGKEDAGTLLAGRGVEAVLREILRRRKVMLQDSRGRLEPACEADFFHLVEIVHRLRWKQGNKAVADQSLKHTLHLLRSMRNALAHPNPGGIGNNARELATLCAKTAVSLYTKVAGSRAQLVSKTIVRDW